jgi:hypothetical protein
MDRDLEEECRYEVFNRLLHNELAKTNYPNIFSDARKTHDLEFITSRRQDVGLTGFDLLT